VRAEGVGGHHSMETLHMNVKSIDDNMQPGQFVENDSLHRTYKLRP
jgi:hypothetical protein